MTSLPHHGPMPCEDPNLELPDESSTLINAADARKLQGRGRGSGTNFSNKNPTRICTYCSRSGHTVDVCCRKHDFPPNYFKNHTAETKSNCFLFKNKSC
ncbi:hypothetical protein A2U01_0009549 [Trifolium medium]|uniref:Uncharacterized protein n=1 Tax=Trifolium medium TaxID=97028 RepID=A0A392MPU4_9FABA|nr:hypothetical protein [Trifolium medium]